MPDVDILAKFVYKTLNDRQFNYYLCSYKVALTGDIHLYACNFSDTTNVSNKYFYNVIFNEDGSFRTDTVQTIKPNNYGNSPLYVAKNGTTSSEFINFNHIFSNVPNMNGVSDLLVGTDYYQKQRDEELKALLQENSSSSDTSVSVDMTTTNNLLWTIGLILCVILLLGFLRKIFNRGVK